MVSINLSAAEELTRALNLVFASRFRIGVILVFPGEMCSDFLNLHIVKGRFAVGDRDGRFGQVTWSIAVVRMSS